MFVKSLKPFVFLVAVMVVVSLACLGSSETPTAEPPPPPPTEAPQQPAQPEQPVQTEEPAPTEEPVSSDAQEFFTEEFDGSNDNWSYFITKNAKSAIDTDAVPYTEDGFLIFELTDWLNVYTMYEPYTYDNVRIDVRVDNRGVNSNNVNLICRFSDEGWYEISIANNGLYKFWVFDGAKNAYAKIADGGSTKIKSGKEINDYALVCLDRSLILYINGIETRNYTDNQYVFRRGQVGVGASAGVESQTENDRPVKLEFDYVEISQP
jgi:hypothetical protein